MTENTKYIFGPVPSRRLGLSLGVDIVPFKTCTLDCLYCQIGPTPQTTLQRKPYVPAEEILAQLQQKLSTQINADYITLSGSGEPTLNSEIGKIIDGIKKLTSIPVAILTNGTMLWDPAVRSDCAKADLVLPSLDAADAETFQKINRPHPDINFEKMITGLKEFTNEYKGKIWLEVFMIDGINTHQAHIENLKKLIPQISPDKIQLNTAVRPTADPQVKRVDFEKLNLIAAQLGPKAEVIADFSTQFPGQTSQKSSDDILSMLKRRPCSLEDIVASLGMTRNEVVKYLSILQGRGVVKSQKMDQTLFFTAN